MVYVVAWYFAGISVVSLPEWRYLARLLQWGWSRVLCKDLCLGDEVWLVSFGSSFCDVFGFGVVWLRLCACVGWL